MAHDHHRLQDAIRITYFQPAIALTRLNLHQDFIGTADTVVSTPGYYVDNDTRINGYMMTETYYTRINEYGHPPWRIASHLSSLYNSIIRSNGVNRYHIINFELDVDSEDAELYDQRVYPAFIRSDWLLDQEDERNGGLNEESIPSTNWLLDQENETNSGGLDEESISKYLTTRNSSNDDDGEEESDEICVVCQDNLCQENHHTIATLECGHEYHPQCIKRWLRRKNVCPLCKATALPCRDEEVQ